MIKKILFVVTVMSIIFTAAVLASATTPLPTLPPSPLYLTPKVTATPAPSEMPKIYGYVNIDHNTSNASPLSGFRAEMIDQVNDPNVYYCNTDSNGYFEINYPYQTGTLRITKNNYLKMDITYFGPDDSNQGSGFTMWAGDVNGDNLINTADQDYIRANPVIDLNGDGISNQTDIDIVGMHLNAQTGTYSTPKRITNPSHNQVVTKQNLQFNWSIVSGATSFSFTLKDLTSDLYVMSNKVTTDYSYTVLSKYFYEGHNYYATVKATVGNRTVTMGRRFSIDLCDERKNILDRAKKMIDFTWVPTNIMYAYKETDKPRYFFQPGQVYGLPYSQTVNQCSISTVPWNNPDPNNSNINRAIYFNTEQQEGDPDFYIPYLQDSSDKYMPFYGSDCSGFTSVCYNVMRYTTEDFYRKTTSFPRVMNDANEPMMDRYARMSPGDALLTYQESSGLSHIFILVSMKPVTVNGIKKYNFTVAEENHYFARYMDRDSDYCSVDHNFRPLTKSSIKQDYTWLWNQ